MLSGEKSIRFYDAEVRNSNYSILLFISLFVRFITKKECTACSRTSYKTVLLINWNKYLYNGKSEKKIEYKSSENNTKGRAAVQFVTK